MTGMDRTRREFLEDALLAAAAALPVAACTSQAGQDAHELTQPASKPTRRSASERLRIGVVGVRGRGRAHVGAWKKSPDAEVVAICDPDSAVIGGAMRAVPDAKYYKDIRKLLEDPRIDAISVATPNHWHSLATIWALQAGKHVYVEKPVSHDLGEGRLVVDAAKRAGRMVQHGTQARSHKATMDAMAWLRAGGLGKVRIARGLCYKRRKSIGKVSGDQKPPATLDYDLWIGPAEMKPLHRKSLHYDWHWDFNTGNGDLGNQGAHQMDIARWGLGRDALPERVVALGGRLGYDDDGNTPNTDISLFDYGDQQIIFEVRGLKTGPYRTAKIGVVFHCEHGYLVSASYSKVVAFDLDGKVVKTFRGGGNHFQNFLDAIRSGDDSVLHAQIREGHLSAGLCHLGNVSYLLGRDRSLAATDAPFGPSGLGGSDAADETFRRMRKHLIENGLDADKVAYKMGPVLTLDPHTERFIGAAAERANALLHRPFRQGYEV